MVRLGTSLLLLALLASHVGCARRRQYRIGADDDVYFLIDQKDQGRNYDLTDYGVYTSPESRMFDPFSPDREPMPPDDPESHVLMHRVDNKRGYPFWHRWGDTPYTQNPEWMSYLKLNEDGVLVLSANEAARLSLIHSPNYQNNLETLYLSALDVSFERFRFDTQFFGGYEVEQLFAGPQAVGSAGTPRSRLRLGTRGVQVNRLFATGAELVVGFANELVWQFSGSNNYSSVTLIDFAFMQPLLRNAGRNKIMERLTLAERTLLANARQMEWFRRGFYLNIFMGEGTQAGPNRRGGTFGAGFTGFVGTATAVGGGGQRFGGIGGGGGTAFGTTAGGFLGLLQRQQQLRNQQANVKGLRNSLARFEQLYEAAQVTRIQVERLRQDLFSATSTYLANRQEYQDQLDQYKAQLGLPPQLPIVIVDSILDAFQLIDEQLTARQDELQALQRQVGEIVVPLTRTPPPPAGEDSSAWREQVRSGLESLRESARQANQLRRQVLEEDLQTARGDLSRLEEEVPRRREFSQQLRQKITDIKANPGVEERLLQSVNASDFRLDYLDSSDADRDGELSWEETGLLDRVRDRLGVLERSLTQSETDLAAIESQIDALLKRLAGAADQELEQFAVDLRDQVLLPLPAAFTSLASQLVELTIQQATARTEQVVLVNIDIEAPLALEVARENRLDWMNQRASLVDTWRLISFNADDLQGFLNINIDGNVTNAGDNPFRLGAATSRLRMGVQFDAPFTRLQERNVYRESLIDYQRARRSYYQYEDGISRTLRILLRQVELQKINFELRRRAVRVSLDQVLLSQLELEQPRLPTETVVDTAAQNVVNALDSLRGAQDAFMGVWISYEILRRLLDQNMGTMRLDGEGLWVDPGPIGLQYGYPPMTAEILSACNYDPVRVSNEGLEEVEGREADGPEAVLPVPEDQDSAGSTGPNGGYGGPPPPVLTDPAP